MSKNNIYPVNNLLKRKSTNLLTFNFNYPRVTLVPSFFVGRRLRVHNGKSTISLLIHENMVGHKLGEFVPTRNLRKRK
nr:ribosomal protein S19 [Cavernulicola chilensis]